MHQDFSLQDSDLCNSVITKPVICARIVVEMGSHLGKKRSCSITYECENLVLSAMERFKIYKFHEATSAWQGAFRSPVSQTYRPRGMRSQSCWEGSSANVARHVLRATRKIESKTEVFKRVRGETAILKSVKCVGSQHIDRGRGNSS